MSKKINLVNIIDTSYGLLSSQMAWLKLLNERLGNKGKSPRRGFVELFHYLTDDIKRSETIKRMYNTQIKNCSFFPSLFYPETILVEFDSVKLLWKRNYQFELVKACCLNKKIRMLHSLINSSFEDFKSWTLSTPTYV